MKQYPTEPPESLEILSSRFNPAPECWGEPTRDCWRVEAFRHLSSRTAPAGTAIVLLDQGRPRLEYVLVADDRRRRGVGTALVRACQHRWPNIDLGLAISDEGQALLDSVGWVWTSDGAAALLEGGR